MHISDLPVKAAVQCFQVVGNDLFAGSDSGIFRSTDDGFSWKPEVSGIPLNRKIRTLGYLGKIFVGTSQGLYSSSDGGSNWDLITNIDNLSLDQIQKLSVSHIICTLYGIFALSSAGVLNSSDGGNQWSVVSTTVVSDANPYSQGGLAAIGPVIFAADGNGFISSTSIDHPG